MSSKTKNPSAQQRIIIVVIAVIAVVLLMVTLAFTAFNGSGLSTKVVPSVAPKQCAGGIPVGACMKNFPGICTIINSRATIQANCTRCGCPKGTKCNPTTQTCR